MEKIVGRVPSDQPPFQTHGWLVDLSASERKLLWNNAVSTMANIHRAPIDSLACLRRDPADANDFEQQVRYWRSNYEWSMDGAPSAVADAAWDWLMSNVPSQAPRGLSWGDARYANIMFDGLTCCAILDWEDVSLGGPLFDLGRWFFAEMLQTEGGCPHLDGLGNREDTIALWERCTGYSAVDVRWFEIFNGACAIGLMARTRQLLSNIPGSSVGPKSHNPNAMERILTRWLESDQT
jgi:aminoglycoside phosphotransferase (APT) family kinase protein